MSSQPQDIIAEALKGRMDGGWTATELACATFAALTSAGYALVKVNGPRDTTPDDPAVLHDRAAESARRILAGEGEVAVPVEALRHLTSLAEADLDVEHCGRCADVLARLDAS